MKQHETTRDTVNLFPCENSSYHERPWETWKRVRGFKDEKWSLLYKILVSNTYHDRKHADSLMVTQPGCFTFHKSFPTSWQKQCLPDDGLLTLSLSSNLFKSSQFITKTKQVVWSNLFLNNQMLVFWCKYNNRNTRLLIKKKRSKCFKAKLLRQILVTRAVVHAYSVSITQYYPIGQYLKVFSYKE